MKVSEMKLATDQYRWIDEWMQMWGAWVYSGRLEKRMSSVIAQYMEAADPSRVMPSRPMCNDDDGMVISGVVDKVIAAVDKRAFGIILSYYSHGSSKREIATYYHKTSSNRASLDRKGNERRRPPSLSTCRREVDQIIESSLWMIYQSLNPVMMEREAEAFKKRMAKSEGRLAV